MDYQPSPPPNSSPNRSLSGMQIVFVAILAIGLLLAINFSNRITAGQTIQGNREALAMEIATLEAEQATLNQELDYVRGDVYVESWARAEGKMVLPGEHLVVPVPAGVPLPTPTPAPPAPADLFTTAEEEVEPWQVWWALFFDDAPPF
ncbi:MAG: septum formation initiator family protein [Anaerolineae bacterium]|nr:septum formation initiator family protein [Anaerolineae bacterium]